MRKKSIAWPTRVSVLSAEGVTLLGGGTMRFVELTLIIAAAAGFALWRGVAMYRQAFQRKSL